MVDKTTGELTPIRLLNKHDNSHIKRTKVKLAGAKATIDIFTPNALEAIANASNGIPRIINKICNCALMIAANKGMQYIDDEIILSAVNDMELA